MALIRLFGRGKSGKSGTGARSDTGAVDASDISAALAGLTTASLSATWRCRHASGVSLAEGSVDFPERSSQAVVIRGKHTYEYVRHSSSVLRTEVLDEALVVQNAPEEAVVEEEGADPEELDGEPAESASESESEGEDEGGESEDEESEDDDEADGDDEPAAEAEADVEADENEEDADEDEDSGEPAAENDEDGEAGDTDPDAEAETAEEAEPKPADEPVRAWNYFSDSDACGPHAYAEPDVLALAALSVGVAQIGKPEEFGGVLHNAYTVTLKPKPTDSDKSLARLARQLRDHGANTIVVTAFTNPDAVLDDDEDDEDELDIEGEDEGVEEYEDFDEVVAGGGLSGRDDEDGEDRRKAGDPAKRIVRLRIELPHWTPADDPGADHSVRIDLFDLGEPVQIESPGRSNATRRTLRTCADLSLF